VVELPPVADNASKHTAYPVLDADKPVTE